MKAFKKQIKNKVKGCFRTFAVSILILIFSTVFSFAGQKVYFYHTDAAGTPLSMTDAGGNVVWQADYKPFGEEQLITESIENKNRFVGKEKDEETGLYYFGARYMGAGIGRFVSVDPVGPVDPWSSNTNHLLLLNPQRLNRYSYGLNNPYRYVDSDGEIVAELIERFGPEAEKVLEAAIIYFTAKGAKNLSEDMKGGIHNENANGDGTKSEDANHEQNSGEPGTYAPDRKLPRDKHGRPVPESENPHTQLGKSPGKKSGKPYTQGREFGKDGKHVRDVDFSVHRHPEIHTNPHQHRIDPKTGERGDPEPLR